MHISTYIYACVYRMSRFIQDSWLSYAWLTHARVQWVDRDLVGVLAGASPTNGSPGLPLPLPYIYIYMKGYGRLRTPEHIPIELITLFIIPVLFDSTSSILVLGGLSTPRRP
jgi:hypothetical protein